MTKIAERLRNHVGSGATHAPWEPGLEEYRVSLLTEAAHELDRLEAALLSERERSSANAAHAKLANENHAAMATALLSEQRKTAAMAEANDRVGSWLSAALDDPGVCAAMKTDINNWFAALARPGNGEK